MSDDLIRALRTRAAAQAAQGHEISKDEALIADIFGLGRPTRYKKTARGTRRVEPRAGITDTTDAILRPMRAGADWINKKRGLEPY
jgi:hypothetical protein